VTVIVSGTATATPTGVAVTVTAGSVGPSTSASAAGNFGSLPCSHALHSWLKARL
jgi:hypothetical protein